MGNPYSSLTCNVEKVCDGLVSYSIYEPPRVTQIILKKKQQLKVAMSKGSYIAILEISN